MRAVCRKVMAKAETVELVGRGVARLKERAQLIVDDIEVDKSDVTRQLRDTAALGRDAERRHAVPPGKERHGCGKGRITAVRPRESGQI